MKEVDRYSNGYNFKQLWISINIYAYHIKHTPYAISYAMRIFIILSFHYTLKRCCAVVWKIKHTNKWELDMNIFNWKDFTKMKSCMHFEIQNSYLLEYIM